MSRKSINFPAPVATVDSRETVLAASANPTNAQFDQLVATLVKAGSLTLALPKDGVKVTDGLSHHAIKQNMSLAAKRAGIELVCGPSAKLPDHWVWFVKIAGNHDRS